MTEVSTWGKGERGKGGQVGRGTGERGKRERGEQNSGPIDIACPAPTGEHRRTQLARAG
jgi:hypothetical protein